jgi:hypothetical protein
VSGRELGTTIDSIPNFTNNYFLKSRIAFSGRDQGLSLTLNRKPTLKFEISVLVFGYCEGREKKVGSELIFYRKLGANECTSYLYKAF